MELDFHLLILAKKCEIRKRKFTYKVGYVHDSILYWMRAVHGQLEDLLLFLAFAATGKSLTGFSWLKNKGYIGTKYNFAVMLGFA